MRGRETAGPVRADRNALLIGSDEKRPGSTRRTEPKPPNRCGPLVGWVRGWRRGLTAVCPRPKSAAREEPCAPGRGPPAGSTRFPPSTGRVDTEHALFRRSGPSRPGGEHPRSHGHRASRPCCIGNYGRRSSDRESRRGPAGLARICEPGFDRPREQLEDAFLAVSLIHPAAPVS
jgi:hypothetical protein